MNSLIQDIQREKNRLVKLVSEIPFAKRTLKMIDGTGGTVSVADLIAYQIGWGKNLIRWYEAGMKGEKPNMPGDGFVKWDYVAIAQYFYDKYHYDASEQQLEVFEQMVSRILEIVECEEKSGQLDKIGVWDWCTLSSGKQWPLCKWIQVNTVAPYKRAIQWIKKLTIYSSKSFPNSPNQAYKINIQNQL